MTGTLPEDMFIMIASRQLLRLINISDRSQSILCVGKNVSWKSCGLWDNVEIYGIATQAADGSIMGSMRFAFWVTKGRDTIPECVLQ